MPREAGARQAEETQTGVFRDQPRINLLLADQEADLVTLLAQAFGHRDARGEMPAGAAAGDEEAAHGKKTPGRGRGAESRGLNGSSKSAMVGGPDQLRIAQNSSASPGNSPAT